MVRSKKMLIVILLVALLAITWLSVVSQGPRDMLKQKQLLEQAGQYVNDEVYIKAIPLLEEAVLLPSNSISLVQEQLAYCYTQIGDKGKLQLLLNQLVDEGTATEAMYLKLIELGGDSYRFNETLEIARKGSEKLQSELLSNIYLQMKNKISIGFNKYKEIEAFRNGFAIVKNEEGYLAINSKQEPAFSIAFERISDFSLKGEAFAIDKGDFILVNAKGQRLAKGKTKVEDIMGISADGRGAVRIDGKWHFANNQMQIGEEAYSYIANENEGLRAVQKEDGKWYLLNRKKEAVTKGYDEILLNSNFAGLAQGRAVVKENGLYKLIDAQDNQIGSQTYEAAAAFEQDGCAAVKLNEAWQFVDSEGNIVLQTSYDEVQSFSCGLAAFRQGALWGFINEVGAVVIEPIYSDIHCFAEGKASGKNGENWVIISLKRFE